jgi:hypothetical protein
LTNTETRSQFFAYPALDQFEELDVTIDARAGIRHHFERALEAIDIALTPGWRSDRTNLAAPELVATLPSRVPMAETPNPPPALGAFVRVRDMLNLDDQRAAALVGISRNTPNNWRRGDRPKDSTTKHLYELAAVLDLVATKEPDVAAWSRSIAPDGRSWLELAADVDGPSAILRARRHDLLTSRPATRLEVASDEEAGSAAAPAAAAADTVRRRPGPRRRPR